MNPFFSETSQESATIGIRSGKSAPWISHNKWLVTAFVGILTLIFAFLFFWSSGQKSGLTLEMYKGKVGDTGGTPVQEVNENQPKYIKISVETDSQQLYTLRLVKREGAEVKNYQTINSIKMSKDSPRFFAVPTMLAKGEYIIFLFNQSEEKLLAEKSIGELDSKSQKKLTFKVN